MNNYLSKLRGQSLLVNTAKLSVSNIIMYVLPIIVTPILSRLYGPAAFGEWGIFSSFTSIVAIVMFLSIDNIIVKAEEEEVGNLLVLCSGIGLMAISLLCVAFTLFNIYDSVFCYMIIIYMLAYFVYTIVYNLNNRYANYSKLAVSNVLQGATQAIARISLGVFFLGVINGLVCGTILAEIITSLFLCVCLIKIDTRKWTTVTVRGVKNLLKKYRKFPLYDAPSNLLAFSTLNLPIIILAGTYSKSSIGCFSIILQLLLLPMSLVGSSMGKVYYQELCSAAGDSKRIEKMSESILNILLIVSVIPMLLLSCGGDYLVVLFLGESWSTAGHVALILSLWSFPVILTQPLLPLFRAYNIQNVLLRYDILYFIGGIGSLLLCCYCSCSMFTTLIVYAATCALVKFALFRKMASIVNYNLFNHRMALSVWIFAVCILVVRLVLL